MNENARGRRPTGPNQRTGRPAAFAKFISDSRSPLSVHSIIKSCMSLTLMFAGSSESVSESAPVPLAPPVVSVTVTEDVGAALPFAAELLLNELW